MRISVVIAAFEAEAFIGESVRAVMSQQMARGEFECVVIDDGSTDRTAAAAKRAGAEVIRLPRNQGASAARNHGIERARGDWVAVTDADCVPSRRWLNTMAEAAESADASVLMMAGKTLGLDSSTPAARFIDLIGALDAERYLRHETMPWAPGGNVVYRREQLVAVGGFDPALKSYESADLQLRLADRFGGRTVYLPSAVVLHRHRPTWRALWKQQRSYGAGYARFLLKHANRWPWSATREWNEWKRIAAFAARACVTRGNDGLVQRGYFVKQLAQRIGFVAEYYPSRPQPRPLALEKELA